MTTPTEPVEGVGGNIPPIVGGTQCGTAMYFHLIDAVRPPREMSAVYAARNNNLVLFAEAKKNLFAEFQEEYGRLTWYLPAEWYATVEAAWKATRMLPFPQMVKWDKEKIITGGQINTLASKPCTGFLQPYAAPLGRPNEKTSPLQRFMLLNQAARCNRATPEGFNYPAQYPALDAFIPFLEEWAAAVMRRFPDPLPLDEQKIALRQAFAVHVAAGFPWVITPDGKEPHWARVAEDGWFAPTKVLWEDHQATTNKIVAVRKVANLTSNSGATWSYPVEAKVPYYLPKPSKRAALTFSTKIKTNVQYAEKCHWCGSHYLRPLRTASSFYTGVLYGRPLYSTIQGFFPHDEASKTKRKAYDLALLSSPLTQEGSPGVSLCLNCAELNTERCKCREFPVTLFMSLSIYDEVRRVELAQKVFPVETQQNIYELVADTDIGERWCVGLYATSRERTAEKSRLSVLHTLRQMSASVRQTLKNEYCAVRGRPTQWHGGTDETLGNIAATLSHMYSCLVKDSLNFQIVFRSPRDAGRDQVWVERKTQPYVCHSELPFLTSFTEKNLATEKLPQHWQQLLYDARNSPLMKQQTTCQITLKKKSICQRGGTQ